MFRLKTAGINSKKTVYFAEKLGLRKRVYGNVITAYVLFLAPKVFFLTILVIGFRAEKKALGSFGVVNRVSVKM